MTVLLAEDFVAALPYKFPSYLCVNKPDYGWASRVRTLEEARKYDTTCLNTHRFANVLAVDIDSPTALRDCYDLNDYDPALVPNVVVENRPEDARSKRGAGHALWFLDDPLVHNTEKSNALYSDLRKRLNGIVPGSDPAFTNYFIKNPGSERWKATVLNETPHSVKVLAERLPHLERTCSIYLPDRVVIDEDLTFNEGSRNHDLFEATRKWAYGEWPKHGTQQSLFKETEMYAGFMNTQCTPPLPHSEVRAIAKSVARWCWKKQPTIKVIRFDPNWNLGAAGLKGKGISEKEARIAGANYTNAIRKEKTQAVLRDVLVTHPGISQTEAAKIADLSRHTVMRHWNEILSAITSLTSPDIGSCSSSSSSCSSPSPSSSSHHPTLNSVCYTPLHTPPNAVAQGMTSSERSRKRREKLREKGLSARGKPIKHDAVMIEPGCATAETPLVAYAIQSRVMGEPEPGIRHDVNTGTISPVLAQIREKLSPILPSREQEIEIREIKDALFTCAEFTEEDRYVMRSRLADLTGKHVGAFNHQGRTLWDVFAILQAGLRKP